MTARPQGTLGCSLFWTINKCVDGLININIRGETKKNNVYETGVVRFITVSYDFRRLLAYGSAIFCIATYLNLKIDN